MYILSVSYSRWRRFHEAGQNQMSMLSVLLQQTEKEGHVKRHPETLVQREYMLGAGHTRVA